MEDPKGTRTHRDVETAAYYIAERRGFVGDMQFEDWLEDERLVKAQENMGQSGRNHVEEDIKPEDIQRWAEALMVRPEELRVAIQRVGPNSTKVKEFLSA